MSPFSAFRLKKQKKASFLFVFILIASALLQFCSARFFFCSFSGVDVGVVVGAAVVGGDGAILIRFSYFQVHCNAAR